MTVAVVALLLVAAFVAGWIHLDAQEDGRNMIVILHFTGGPKDGDWKRTSSRKHRIGSAIVRRHERGYYTSIDSWDGLENHVSLYWFYGTPELHAEMKAASS